MSDASEILYKPLLNLILPPISGKRPSGGVDTETEGIPSLGGENILTDGGVTYDVIKRIPYEYYRLMPKGKLQPLDVLINKDGAQTGKVGIYRNEFIEAAINEHLFILRSFDSRTIDQFYLFYCLLLPETRQKIERRITGSAQPGLNSSFVNSVSIPYHKKSIQRKIATILTSIDTAIEKTETLIQKYQQIKAGLMQDLFTRGITADGKLRPPREQAPELYQETPIGWIPKEWKPKKLGKIVSFQRGHDIVEADFVDGKFPVVSSGGVIGYHNEYTTKAPNVVVGRKGTIGKVHFIETKFWAHDTSLFTTDFFGNIPLFVYYLCVWLDLGRFGTRSGSPSLNRNDIHPLNIACPNYDEQERIIIRLIACDKKIQTLNEDLIKLNKIKQGLMQDLLTGKVRVKVDQPETADV